TTDHPSSPISNSPLFPTIDSSKNRCHIIRPLTSWKLHASKQQIGDTAWKFGTAQSIALFAQRRQCSANEMKGNPSPAIDISPGVNIDAARDFGCPIGIGLPMVLIGNGLVGIEQLGQLKIR